MFTSHKCAQWLTLALACLVYITEASCPNKCSGHGACGTNDVCACKQNWTGGDCSLRVCPYTRAWVDAPKNDNDAHYYAECGNKGTCDRTTGMCVCDAGYTGSGCRRQVCPNDCSGHGTCEFIDELSSSAMTASWEQEKIMGCTCDPGFTGHDCAARICPKGDDPVTSYDQNGMEQYIHYKPMDTAGTPGAAPADDYPGIYLSYVDPYGATWTTAAITPSAVTADATTKSTFCTAVQTALRAVPQLALKDVTATVIATGTANDVMGQKLTRTTNAVSDGTVTAVDITVGTDVVEYACKIVFPNAAGTSGLQNILQCHKDAKTTAGSQPLLLATAGQTTARNSANAEVTCVTGEFAAAVPTANKLKLTELATCSNRGLCDETTGDCQCFAGHRGLACETQEALV